MSFFSDLFLAANVKHYRRLAKASGEVRDHAGKQTNIELNLLSMQHDRLEKFRAQVFALGENDLVDRIIIVMGGNDEFFGRVKRFIDESREEHKVRMTAAIDAAGLSALCDHEAELTAFFKIAKDQALERLEKTNEVTVAAINVLKEAGAF